MSVKIAVVGVGSLGQHHARILRQHPSSKLEFVVDIDIKRAEKVAKINKTNYLSDFTALVDKIDAAVIAVPTPYHYTVAKLFLQNGIHCLVEKPFTMNVMEAEMLVEIARARNLVLQVGYVERFNPAVIAAVPFINNPKFIEVNRLGTYNPKTNHIGVVLDLMIHDLDILFYLVKDKVISIEAYGAKVLSDTEDIAKVRLKYANGCIADMSVSRISMEKYRRIRIFQFDSYISIDYARKKLKVYTKKEGKKNITSFSDIDVKKPKLSLSEPLFCELDNFLDNIIEGKKPIISGEQGRDTMKIAHNILKNMILQ
jgi:predicted dehydrogenase